MRDFGFMVTDGEGFFAEEKRDTDSQVRTDRRRGAGLRAGQHPPPGDGAPRFRIHKRIVTDPGATWCCRQVRLEALWRRPLRLFALLAPHLVNAGAHNTGWLGEYKGQPMLFAEGAGSSLALAASIPGQRARRAMPASATAGRTCPALPHDLAVRPRGRRQRGADRRDRHARGRTVMLALGFGRSRGGGRLPRPRQPARAEFDGMAGATRARGDDWQAGLRPLDRTMRRGHNTYRVSTAVLRAHEARTSPAASSPACPSRGAPARATTTWAATTWCGRATWWRRRAGCWRPVRTRRRCAVLEYLRATQEADGPGRRTAGWTARPTGAACRWTSAPSRSCWWTWRSATAPWRGRAAGYWPMVRAAAGFLVRTRPRHRAGPLGGEWRLLALHPGRGDRRPAGRRRRGRGCDGVAAAALPARHRGLPGTTASRPGPTPAAPTGRGGGGRRLLRAHVARPAAVGRRRLDGTSCSWQEPAGRRGPGAGQRRGQPGRAGAGALRPARGRRPAHPATPCG